MRTNRTRAVLALVVAGVAWGASVPLSKEAMGWLGPAWLTAARFALAALLLLPFVPRHKLRAACSWQVLAWGAVGYGGSVLVQNVGVDRTSVTHAALLIGSAPVLVAIIAAVWQGTMARPVAWAGFALSLAGVTAITAGGGSGGGATSAGDALVLAATLISAAVTVAQGGLVADRDPVALTVVLLGGAAAFSLPLAFATQGLPAAPASAGPVLAVAALTLAGTVLPFTLFTYGQRHVSAELAGAFLNLEPLVGAIAGVVFFANPAGPRQLLGGGAVLAGIALSSLPLLRGSHRAATGRQLAASQTATGPLRIAEAVAEPVPELVG
jgi:drug/metabolite transporter (DMT)-like permease